MKLEHLSAKIMTVKPLLVEAVLGHCETSRRSVASPNLYGPQVRLPREIQFRSGRVDCVSEYQGEWERFKTDRAEIHPNPEVSRYLDMYL